MAVNGNIYRRERGVMANDPFERLNAPGQAVVRNGANFFEGMVHDAPGPAAAEAEKRALMRAMARFLIDSGLASARGYV